MKTTAHSTISYTLTGTINLVSVDDAKEWCREIRDKCREFASAELTLIFGGTDVDELSYTITGDLCLYDWDAIVALGHWIDEVESLAIGFSDGCNLHLSIPPDIAPSIALLAKHLPDEE